MIKQLPLFVSLLLALNYAAVINREIDFKRCFDDETTCFIKKSCLIGKTDDDTAKKNLVEFKYSENTEQITDGKCDVAIQIKKFSDYLSIIIINVEKNNAEEMKIVQDGKSMISCKKGENAGGEVDGNPDFHSEHEITPSFDPNGKSICSFLIKQKDGKEPRVFLEDTFKDAAPSLVYGTDSIEYEMTGNDFWTRPRAYCKGGRNFILSTLDTTTNLHVLAKVDIFQMEFGDCPGGNNLLVKHNGNLIETAKVECNKDKKWSWDSTVVELKVKNELEVSCITKKFCTECSDLTVFKCNPPDSCKDPEKNNDAATGCLAYKCKDNKWVKGGEDVISTSEGAVCKRKDTSEESAWYIQDKGVPELIPASGVTCREKYMCTNKRINLGCSGECPAGKSAPTLDEVNSVFNCTNGGQLYQSDNNVHPTCDHSNGEWKGLTEGDHLYCEVKEKVEEKAEPQSGGGGVVGAIVGIMIAASVVVGGALGYFLWWKPKQARQASKATTSKKGSSKKSTESGTKKPSDSDPPEKAGSGKEGGVPTDVEKLKTEPVPSGTKNDGAAPATPAAPAAAAPPPPPAAPTPV